ncbi:MAG: exonuclease SbcCD subunit D [Actinomycetaceae bacterium]
MRILHTSDWHLGRTLHGVDLTDAHADYLDHLVEVVRSEKVDAVVVAGDVYDRAIPPTQSVTLLGDALTRLTEIARVVLTPGNHDSAVRLGFSAGLMRDRLSIRATVADVGVPTLLPDAEGNLGAYVYALPYLDPDMARADLTEPADDGSSHDGEGNDGDRDAIVPPRSHEGVVGAAMRRVHADLARRRATDGARVPAVLMAHAFVAGGAASESERDIRVGGVDVVPSGVFTTDDETAPLDYAALGHLHGAQQVRGAVTARYSGSPVAFSFSEESHTKSSVLVDLEPGGEVRTELVEAPVRRRLATLRGTIDELTSGAFDDHAEDYVRVTVTDATRPRHMRARLVEHLPHLLVLAHEPVGATALGGPLKVTAAEDPVEVAAQFVADAGGAEATAAERAVLREAVETAHAGQGAA